MFEYRSHLLDLLQQVIKVTYSLLVECLGKVRESIYSEQLIVDEILYISMVPFPPLNSFSYLLTCMEFAELIAGPG